MKKSPLRKKSKNPVAEAKAEIQSWVRAIVILRDGGCILRDIRHCGGLPGQAILQADHLVTRSYASTYADTNLIVCLCKPCHGGFKKWHEKEYNSLVRGILSPQRVELWDRREKERLAGITTRMYLSDWKLEIFRIKIEYLALQKKLEV